MKKRKLSERTALVNKYHRSGQSPSEFAKKHGVHPNTVSKWLKEAQELGSVPECGSGFVEVDTNYYSSPSLTACRAVVGNISFEFGVLPGPRWLAEFANSVCMKEKM